MNKLSDIINDSSPIKHSVIIHAAEISKLVEENSFSICENKQITISSADNELEVLQQYEGKGIKNSKNNEDPLVLDMVLIHQNISLKNAEKDRQDKMKQQIRERQQKFLNENKKLKQQIQTATDLKSQKLKSDEKICETAEYFIKQVVKLTDQKIDQMHKEKDKKLKSIQHEALVQNQTFFKDNYQKYINLLLFMDKKHNIHCEKYIKKSREIAAKYDKIIKKVKTDMIVTTDDISYAHELCNELKELENNLILECAKKQQLQNTANFENIENNKLAQIVPIQTATNIVKNTNSLEIPDSTDQNNVKFKYVNEENLKFYNQIMTEFNDKLEKVKPLLKEEKTKKYRKELNIAVGKICAVSPQHLEQNFKTILSIVTDNSLLTDFCLIHLANLLVKQCETEVSSNSNAAFALATTIISIWNRIPEFGIIFLGEIYKKSPYLVPYFIPKQKSQSHEDYLKTLGYPEAQSEMGVQQASLQERFLKRQTAFVRLYAAVIITFGRKADGNHHPHGIENGWRWLSSFVKLKPLPDVCATILHEFLQVAGSQLWATYGIQFHKMLTLIEKQYLIEVVKSFEDVQPAGCRLENYIKKILKEKKIQIPSGIIEKNYW